MVDENVKPRAWMQEEGNLTKKARKDPWVISTIVLGVALLAVVVISLSYEKEEVVVVSDDFAQCLTDSGLVMYGTEWCSFCTMQKELLGDSFDKINYIDCDLDKEACIAAGITGFPTWTMDGMKYNGVQSLEQLSEISGCLL